MHKVLAVLVLSLSLLSIAAHADGNNNGNNPVVTPPSNTPAQKDWTLLVYLNGDNNLDPFGTTNMLQMEKVGSTDQINIVVQWASLQAGKTTRVLVQKGTNPQQVTSPVVQDLGVVDMGDYKNLQAFIEWGAKTYPAKHYFVDVWDHGSGWHALHLDAMNAKDRAKQLHIHPMDISWDDNSGNHITTAQLAQALAGASATIGQKIDLYGSDACMMGMAEVAKEMADSVTTFVGSEEVEPGAGWPYDTILTRWAALQDAQSQDIAKIVVEEYVKAYAPGGETAGSEVTGSAFDLTKIDAVTQAVTDFGAKIAALNAADKAKALTAAQSSQAFTDADYVDLQDFLTQLEGAGIDSLTRESFSDLRQALAQFTIENADTTNYAKAKGLSMWVPTDASTLSSYEAQYQTMKFDQATHWSKALDNLLKTTN